MEAMQAEPVTDGQQPVTSADVVSKVLCLYQGKPPSQVLAVTIDQIRPPNEVQNRRNKQSFDTYAFIIDIVPFVLEKTCFTEHTFEYKWKIIKRRNQAKRKADPMPRNEKTSHPTNKFGPNPTMAAL